MDNPSRLIWKKYRKNIPALLGTGYLIICVIVALLGYALPPDSTTHANFQLLEVAKQPPGTRAQLLLVPQTPPPPQRNMLGRWLFGKRQSHVPIVLSLASQPEVRGDYLLFQRYNGSSDSLLVSRLIGVAGEENSGEVHWQSFIQHQRFLLGTDSYGRDLFSRILLGTRVSLTIGLMAVLLSLFIGVSLGTIAGYFGGRTDRLIMWLVSVVWSIPTLLLALALSFVLGKGFWQVFVAIGLSMWVEVARIVRGQIMSVREQQYVEAARTLGYQNRRIMLRHILPNVLSPIIVIAVANFGSAVLIESGLSFLGIGVEVPIPSWGSMIYQGYTYIVFSYGKWLAFFPGLALILLVVSINLVGIGLRDALDVKI